MRKLIALGLVTLLAACADTATEPELSDGPQLQGAQPVIVIDCKADIGRDAVVLPDDADRLQEFITACHEAGSHTHWQTRRCCSATQDRPTRPVGRTTSGRGRCQLPVSPSGIRCTMHAATSMITSVTQPTMASG
jgi:hypothetical protein